MSTSEVGRRLGLGEVTAWRRVQIALRGDFLRNLETRPRVRSRLVLGGTPLDETVVLPRPEDLL